MEREKQVDESWKETASEEKENLEKAAEGSTSQESGGGAQQEKQVEINFVNYVTSLGFQALIFMGEVPNPITNQTEKNLIQSKFIIDTLDMLKGKTEGNLSDQESNFLDNTIHDLQMKYVEVVKKEQEQPSGEQSEENK